MWDWDVSHNFRIMNDLKPCPFCGCPGEQLTDGRGRWALFRHKEGCFFPIFQNHEISSYEFESWNTRVNDMTDEQRSHLTRLAEEMVDVLTLSGGGI